MIRKYGIWLLIFIFGSIYSFYSIIRHLRQESFIFDLGIYDQIIWLASRGKPLFSSILEAHAWGDHFTPTLLLLSPLYWIWDKVVILLLFQAFFCSFGAYPIYLLSQKKLKDKSLSLIIAFAYLFFFGIQNALGFDFHPIVLATTLLSWLFWFYEEKEYLWFWLILILLVGLQENFFLLAASLGFFLIFHYRDFKKGLVMAIASLALFLGVILVIIPYFGQKPFTYLPTHLKNLTFWEGLKLLVYPVSKVQLMLFSLLAFGFLPIFTPTIFIILFEEFFQRFVGTPINTRWNLTFQYNSILTPILAFGTIEALQKKFLKRKKLAIFLILGGSFLTQVLTKPALNNLLRKDFYDFSKGKDSRAILALIPKTASVKATNNLGPQLTHREKITFLTNCQADPRVWKQDMKRCFILQPDYLVADLDPQGHWNNFYPDNSRESLWQYLTYVQESGEYRLIKQQGEVFLLKKN